MVAGFGGNIATNLVSLLGGVNLPVYMDPILVGAAISFLTVIAVSNSGTVSSEEHAFREQLHHTPKDELNTKEVRRTLVWPTIIMILGVVIMVTIAIFYAQPYRTAIESRNLLEDATIDGEFVLAIGYGLVLICAGALMRWGVRKYYIK